MFTSLSAKAIDEIKAAAHKAYPNEMCGLIVGSEFIECVNVHTSPTTAFKIENSIYLAAATSNTLQAVVHSHPIHPDEQFKWDPRTPSKTDMETWLAASVPFGIVACNGRSEEEVTPILWLDDNDIPPLEGRTFIHGVHDCYSLVRDYFRTEQNIVLPNYARSTEWWSSGEDLYDTQFEDAGFIEIPFAELQVGDCCLFKVASPVINHAAVITGQDQILHHLFNRLSAYDTLSRWTKYITKYVRYKGKETNATESMATRKPRRKNNKRAD